MRRLLLAVLLLAAFAPVAALAVTPDEMLKDPALEARARHISEGLRCLVCQNESIDDSQAPLAHDLRVLVRKRLVAGDTDRQVVDYIVARYGEFVLLKPRFELRTLALWGLPPAALVAGMLGLVVALRRRKKAGPDSAPLSAAEQQRVAALMKGGAG
ncbi:MAG TPA: cytochrome c-type biogenesis protein [Pseudolabrys sp.]|nr:cytochrome c-type biogenesis protein [Pseudolabrys sp.]